MQDQINLFFESLELSTTGYTVLICRDELNKIITDISFDNCQIKNLLFSYFDKGRCFTYLNDRKKIVFFYEFLCWKNCWIPSQQDRWRCNYSMCKNITNKECNPYKFDIDNFYCDANDVNISFNMYNNDRLKSWKIFFKSLVKVRSTSEDLTRKCDTLFQQIFYLIHNRQKKLLSMLG